MKEPSLQLSQDLMRELHIREDSIKVVPFQGEMCTVFNAYSEIHGALVIKTALKAMQVTEEGQREIHQNKKGYSCIPQNFRPEIIAIDEENAFLVMPNVGKPLRDLLWENQYSLERSEEIVVGFLGSLDQLLNQTRTRDIEARNSFLDELQNIGLSFLQEDFFPRELVDKFTQMVTHAKQVDDGKVAFATLDMTQGNLLIDVTKNPQTLKIIDPKRPRLVLGSLTFLGVSEVDLGMFIATLSLNAPETVQHLRIEDRIKEMGLDNFTFDLGKLFGYILIASFPNTTERVHAYFQSVGASWNEDVRKLVETEREIHVKKAMDIADSMEVTGL